MVTISAEAPPTKTGGIHLSTRQRSADSRARPVVVPVCAADMRGFRGVAAVRFSPVFFGGVTLADHSVHMRECCAAKKGREIDIISLL